MTQESAYTHIGIPGLDELLGKGIPRGHVISLFGGPGAGKTTFALQFIINGAEQFNEPGLYVSLDESIDDIRRNMQNYGWDLNELEKNKKIVLLDASFFKTLYENNTEAPMKSSSLRQFNLGKIGQLIRDAMQTVDAKRVVLDPVSTVSFQYTTENERRFAIIDLISSLRSKKDCTSLIVAELRASNLNRDYQLEEFLTQGTIVLQTLNQQELGLTRICYIEKMRGVQHDTQPHIYSIAENGIRVFPSEKVYLQ